MKKVFQKVKKIIIGIIFGIITIPNKIYGTEKTDWPVALYAPPHEKITSIEDRIFGILKGIIVPLILIIGLIIYIVKSKNKQKYLIAICIIIISVVLYFILKVVIKII